MSAHAHYESGITRAHYGKAVALLERADSWADFDRWPMSDQERLARAANDLAAAQVHAILSLGHLVRDTQRGEP